MSKLHRIAKYLITVALWACVLTLPNGWAYAVGYFGVGALYALAAGLMELTPRRRQERAAVAYLTGLEAFAAQRKRR